MSGSILGTYSPAVDFTARKGDWRVLAYAFESLQYSLGADLDAFWQLNHNEEDNSTVDPAQQLALSEMQKALDGMVKRQSDEVGSRITALLQAAPETVFNPPTTITGSPVVGQTLSIADLGAAPEFWNFDKHVWGVNDTPDFSSGYARNLLSGGDTYLLTSDDIGMYVALVVIVTYTFSPFSEGYSYAYSAGAFGFPGEEGLAVTSNFLGRSRPEPRSTPYRRRATDLRRIVTLHAPRAVALSPNGGRATRRHADAL